MKPLVVSIDGVSASGKSTLAEVLAKRLGLDHVNAGNLYRVVTIYLRGDAESLSESAIRFVEGTPIRLTSEGIVVGSELIEHWRLHLQFADQFTPHVAAHPRLRAVVRGWQRDIARRAPKGVVMEGRDIGTVVFPDAPLKFWLTAGIRARAERRIAQMARSREPFKGSVDDMIRLIAERDEKDRSRAHSPLVQPPDAVVVDTSGKHPAESLDEMMSAVMRCPDIPFKYK